MTRQELISEIIADLTVELENENDFNEDLLANKVRSAVREVITARRYPAYYTEETINQDLVFYYSNIRNIAMFDYNQIGVEGQTEHLENETRRTYVSRNSLFYGILPLSHTTGNR